MGYVTRQYHNSANVFTLVGMLFFIYNINRGGHLARRDAPMAMARLVNLPVASVSCLKLSTAFHVIASRPVSKKLQTGWQ